MRRIALVGLVLLLPGCTGRVEQQSSDKPETNQTAIADDSDSEESTMPAIGSPEVLAAMPATESPEVLAAQLEEIQEQLRKFVETPNHELYLNLRQQVVTSSEYEPYSDEFEIAQEMLI